MNNNLSEEQLEIKERLERIINIFTYRYIKAGTKSKKNLIASDLISLSRINREYFSDFKLNLSWDSDDSLYTESLLSCYKYIENIIINQDKYFKIFNSAVEQILSTKPNIYRYYGKDYLKHPKKELGIVFISFLESFDTKLYNQYMSMLDRENIFYASLKGYNGQNYPFSILNENMIFIDSSFEENVKNIAQKLKNDSRKYDNDIFSSLSFNCHTIETACLITLLELIKHDTPIYVCKNCGKYFIPSSKKNTLYCNNIYEHGKTCQEIGAMITYNEKLKKDEINSLYRKTLSAKKMLANRNPDIPMYLEKYEKWKNEANKFKKDIKQGLRTEEEFLKWIEETRKK